MKLDSLVIAHQPWRGEYVPGPCTHRPGFKFADYELKGVPVRLVMGGRDLENGTIEVMRRDTLEKQTISVEGIEEYVICLLQ